MSPTEKPCPTCRGQGTTTPEGGYPRKCEQCHGRKTVPGDVALESEGQSNLFGGAAA